MKQQKIIACILFFAFNSLHAPAQNENFSGSWKLNKDKTGFGKLSENYATTRMNVTQGKDTIGIERFSSPDGQNRSYLEKMSFDGQPVKSMIGGGTTRKLSSVKWSPDRHTLIETGDYTSYSPKTSYKVTEVWSLSEDKKTLTITRTDEGEEGKLHSIFVYEKGE